MSQNFIEEFIKRAQASGLTKEQAEQFVQQQMLSAKQAEAQQLEEFISNILNESEVEKTAQSVAYVEGVLKAAVESGCTIEQATGVSKVALAKVKQGIQEKRAATPSPELAQYANEFLKAASEAGLAYGQSVDLLKIAIQKQSNDPALMAQLQALLGGQGGQGGQGGMPPSALGGGAGSPNVLQALLGGGGGMGGAPGMGAPAMGAGAGPGMGGAGSLFKQLPQ